MAYMVIHEIQQQALERLKEVVSRTPQTSTEAERDGIIAGTSIGILRALDKLDAAPSLDEVASLNADAAPEPYIPCECPVCAPEAGLDEDVEYVAEFVFPSLIRPNEFDLNMLLYTSFFGDKP